MKPVTDFHWKIADRIFAAERFRTETKIGGDIVCDTMDNGVLSTFQAFPDRVLVVMNGALVHVGGPPDVFGLHYNVDNVLAWLHERYPGRRLAGSVLDAAAGAEAVDTACAS
jgi:hypothetical protein